MLSQDPLHIVWERTLGLQLPRLCLLHNISSSSVVSAFAALGLFAFSLLTETLHVIFQKRVRVFHRGSKHEKTDDAVIVLCFLETPMKHEARGFEITSPTKEN